MKPPRMKGDRGLHWRYHPGIGKQGWDGMYLVLWEKQKEHGKKPVVMMISLTLLKYILEECDMVKRSHK